MKLALFATLLVLITRVAVAECTGPTLVVDGGDQHFTAVFNPDVKDIPDLADNSPVTITAGKTIMHTIVRDTRRDALLGTFIALRKPDDAKFQDGMLVLDTANQQATFTFGDAGNETSVDLCVMGQVNNYTETINVGLAQAGDNDSDTAVGTAADAESNDSDTPTVLRFQYDRTYRRFRPVRRGPGLIDEARNMELEYGIHIDTTDEDDDAFVDDNRLSGALFTPRLKGGRLLGRFRAGIRGEHARAIHGGDHNTDAELTLEGGLPFLQSRTLGAVRRLAEPLQFVISGGRRWQDVDDTRSDGWVAEARLRYHLYLGDEYRFDLEYGTLLNNVTHRPASTPRTQHSWKASVFLFENSRFTAVATYENGHSGPVYTQLRQYFVGVALNNALSTFAPTAP